MRLRHGGVRVVGVELGGEHAAVAETAVVNDARELPLGGGRIWALGIVRLRGIGVGCGWCGGEKVEGGRKLVVRHESRRAEVHRLLAVEGDVLAVLFIHVLVVRDQLSTHAAHVLVGGRELHDHRGGVQADAVNAVKCGALAANAGPAACEDCTIHRRCELCVPIYALAASVDRQLSAAPRVFAFVWRCCVGGDGDGLPRVAQGGGG